MAIRRHSLAALIRNALARLGFDGYDPARHYMRGPGPKARARQASRKTDDGASSPAQGDAAKERRD